MVGWREAIARWNNSLERPTPTTTGVTPTTSSGDGSGGDDSGDDSGGSTGEPLFPDAPQVELLATLLEIPRWTNVRDGGPFTGALWTGQYFVVAGSCDQYDIDDAGSFPRSIASVVSARPRAAPWAAPAAPGPP